MSAKSKPSAKPKKPVKKPAKKKAAGLFTLDVAIIGGPVTKKFADKNPEVSRVIQIRGDQTLEDLHFAIFDAFDREDQHCYEFQFGKGPMDPKAVVFTMPEIYESREDDRGRKVHRADKAKIETLSLKVGQAFGYWFDFGDDWWHQINVSAIDEVVPGASFPKVIKKVGKSPPQYPR